jgi:hypothetical protein
MEKSSLHEKGEWKQKDMAMACQIIDAEPMGKKEVAERCLDIPNRLPRFLRLYHSTLGRTSKRTKQTSL